jgi:4-alpha-glucanotransferase
MSGPRTRDKTVPQPRPKENLESIRQVKFLQYLFYRQWAALKSYCNERCTRIIGDMPIYVRYTARPLTHPRYFRWTVRSGLKGYPVCRRLFQRTGQLWETRFIDGRLRELHWWIRGSAIISTV